jgi:hypothetical protein
MKLPMKLPMKPLWVAITACACASSPVPHSRFTNAPPVAAVNDRLDVPVRPEERPFFENLYHYNGLVQDPIDRAFELPRARRALGVNALDEVPDSTWFTNRIGVRTMSLAELANGPVTIETPELHKPWTIKSTKVGGAEVGFAIVDARGEKFMLKFDTRGFPEQETATDVIVGKLLWACGYNVPEDFVVDLRREDLVLAPDAVMTDPLGNKQRLDRAELDRKLAKVEIERDGRIRAYASRWLPGKALGGHPGEGVRRDDPNDRIPHELRRDLRGSYATFSWVDHVDVQESNYLDTWVQDPREPGRHYVKHHLLDFGKSLGVMATTGHDPRRGHAYVVDFGDMTRSLVSAGTLERSWEERRVPKRRGVGLFDAASFDPGAWKPDYPSYLPFLTADRFDKFWGAKILVRFTREQIHAIVETGKFSDPATTEYVTDTLVARQRLIADHWFARVNPLDRFTVTSDRLCFDDLSVRYGFTPPARTSYQAISYDRETRNLGAAASRPDGRGRACLPLVLAAGGDGYTMTRIQTTRPGFTGTTIVHLARDPAGAPRVVGIWRT